MWRWLQALKIKLQKFPSFSKGLSGTFDFFATIVNERWVLSVAELMLGLLHIEIFMPRDFKAQELFFCF